MLYLDYFYLKLLTLWQRTDNSIISFLIPNVKENWNLSPFIRVIFLSFAQFAHHLWLECVTGYPAVVIVFFLFHDWMYLYRVSGALMYLFIVCFCVRRRVKENDFSFYGIKWFLKIQSVKCVFPEPLLRLFFVNVTLSSKQNFVNMLRGYHNDLQTFSNSC